MISEERSAVEARLVEQEHRPTHIALNLFHHARSDNEVMRQAAWRAALWRLFTPRIATASVVSAGIASVVLASLGLIVAIRANALLERQNFRMDVQNTLTESQRRSSLLAQEIASISAQIDAERKLPTSKPSYAYSKEVETNEPDFVPSATLTGRIVSLTLALRPYRPVVILEGAAARTDDYRRPTSQVASVVDWLARFVMPLPEERTPYQISDNLSSPERGQLLLALLPHNIEFSELERAGATFAYADLSGSVIARANLRRISLQNANFRNARIDDVWFRGVDLSGATFDGANFTNARLLDVSLRGTTIGGVSIDGGFRFQKRRGGENCNVRNVTAAKLSPEVGGETIDGLSELLSCNVEMFEAPDSIAEKIAQSARAKSYIFTACRPSENSLGSKVRFGQAGCLPDAQEVFPRGQAPAP